MALEPSDSESESEETNMFQADIERKYDDLATQSTQQQAQFQLNKAMAASLLSSNTNNTAPINDEDVKQTEKTNVHHPRPDPPQPRPNPPSSRYSDDNKSQYSDQSLFQSTKYSDFNSMSNILRRELLNGCDKMNFTHPSKIQAEAIPCCLADGFPNLIGQAHHGSGKTATFALIMLQRIDETKDKLQGLVVVHSRELAIQIYTVCTSLGQFISGLKIASAIRAREMPIPWQHQICIGTPGTLIDKVMNRQRRVKGGLESFLSEFKILIIDEADEFLQSDLKTKYRYRSLSNNTNTEWGTLFDQLKMITADLTEHVTAPFQRLLFSATFPATVKKYAIGIAPKATVIKVARKEVQLKNVRVFCIMCTDYDDKFNTLLNVIKLANAGQMIVFANSVWQTENLIESLESKRVGIACSALYGRGMDVFVRDKTMDEFRKSETQCLVASNVIARGIDVPAVGLVVNFEIPITEGHSTETGCTGYTFDSETFMHRVGRTGRFGVKGVCINLIGNSDSSIDNERLNAIQKEYSLNIEMLDKSPKAIKESITKWLHSDQYN